MAKRTSGTRAGRQTQGKRPRKPTAAALDKLIEEATVDAHDESEQIMGLFTTIQDELPTPFETDVLGVIVVVDGVELTDREEIVAVCTRGGRKQRIPIVDLPLPTPPPEGYEWIEAYRRWAGGAAAAKTDDEE